MTEWTDHALVLRLGRFREADLWLKLLCRHHGLLTLFAFGGSRSRRRFCGCLDVLNSLQCRVRVSGRSRFLNLEEAVLLEGPQALRQDWRRMGLAANCLRFVEALGVNEEGAGEAFALVEDLRRTLEADAGAPPLLPQLFRLRFAGAMGFAPNLGACGLCGRAVEGSAVFAVDEGQLYCTACQTRRRARYGIALGVAGLDLLRHVQQEFPSVWRPRKLPPDEWRACGRLIDGFVQYHLGLAWDKGRFRRV